MSDDIKEIDEIILCSCGHPDTPHKFRHLFNPTVFINKCVDSKGELFIIDAEDFKPVEIFGKCGVFQCNADKMLHGTIIKHEYSPTEKYKKRTICFTLPLNTLCRVCKIPLETHESLTHPFTTLVKVQNIGEKDNVIIRGKTVDQTIIWKET